MDTRPPRPHVSRDQPHSNHHLNLPAGAHVADRRGLTATGAVTIALVLGFVEATIDVNTGRGLRGTFAGLFVLGSALAALLVHRAYIKATVVMPPLTYCVLALIGAGLGHTQAAGSREGPGPRARQRPHPGSAHAVCRHRRGPARRGRPRTPPLRLTLRSKPPDGQAGGQARPAALRSRRSSGGKANSRLSLAAVTSSTSA